MRILKLREQLRYLFSRASILLVLPLLAVLAICAQIRQKLVLDR